MTPRPSPVAWTDVGAAAPPTDLAGPIAPPPTEAIGLEERFTIADIEGAFKKITPSLLILAAFSGAAFALGAGLISKYVLPSGKR